MRVEWKNQPSRPAPPSDWATERATSLAEQVTAAHPIAFTGAGDRMVVVERMSATVCLAYECVIQRSGMVKAQ